MKDNLIGQNIRTLRKYFHLTQVELANALECDNSTISSYETGRTVPDHENVKQIADYFWVSVDDLVSRPLSFDKSLKVNTEFSKKGNACFFPCVFSERSLHVQSFYVSFQKHQSILTRLVSGSVVTEHVYDDIEFCFDKYETLLEEASCGVYAAANL